MDRQGLHDLVERIPDSELPAAQRFLEYLAVSPAYHAAQRAPADDEAVSAGDQQAIERARKEVEAGRVSTHAEVLREFGLR